MDYIKLFKKTTNFFDSLKKNKVGLRTVYDLINVHTDFYGIGVLLSLNSKQYTRLT